MAEEKILIPLIIKKLDGIYATGDLAAAENLLEEVLSTSRETGDWSAELSILSEMMGFYRRNSNKEKGLYSVRKGLEIIEKHSLSESISGATVMLNAATTLKAFGEPQESLQIFQRVLNTFNNKLTPNDYRFAGLYNNMALTLVDLGNFGEAESLYNKALEVLTHCDNPLNEMAVTYCNMAYMYDAVDHEDKRIGEVLKMAEECLDSESVIKDGYYAFTASKCYPAFEYFGYFLTAERLKKISESIYESNR